MHLEGTDEKIIVIPNQVGVITNQVLRSHGEADVIRISHIQCEWGRDIKHLEHLYHSMEYAKQIPFILRVPLPGLQDECHPEIGGQFLDNVLN